MPAYRYLVADLMTGAIKEEMPFTSASYSHVLNRPGAFSATIGLREPVRTTTRLSNVSVDLPGTSGNYISTPDSDSIDVMTNRLTANQSGIETSTTGWVSSTNTPTIARSTAQFRTGAASLSLTATAAGPADMAAGTTQNSPSIPVVQGESFTATAYFRAATTTRNVFVQLDWHSALSGGYITSTVGAVTADTDTGWTLRTVTGTAPAGALYVRVIVKVQNTVAGETHYVDDISLVRGTGDIDLRVKASLDDWTPVAPQTLIAKAGAAGNRSWIFWVTATGALQFFLYQDGTNGVSTTSTVVTGFADGAVRWCRATWRNSDDRVQFFTSEDGATWTQLGVDRTIARDSIFDSTAPVELGSYNNGTSERLAGNVYSAEVRNGIDGPVVAKFDTSKTTTTATRIPSTIDDPTATWTVNGTGWNWAYTSTTTTAPPKVTRANLDPGRTAIYVERDGVLVWGGILWTAKADIQSARVQIGGEGFWSYFRHRYVRHTKNYVLWYQHQIARDLVNYAQAQAGGNIGLLVPDTIGSVGPRRDRTYHHYERKNVGEAVEQLAAVQDGFDFAIELGYDASGDIVKTLDFDYPRRGRMTSIVFELGTNIEGLTQEIDATRQANLVDGIGSGEGDQMLVATASDLTLVPPYPLLEEIITFKDVSEVATMAAKAQSALAAHKTPLERLPTLLAHASPDVGVGTFITGDTVRVRGEDGFFSVDELMRITNYQVVVDENGGETISIGMESETDFS